MSLPTVLRRARPWAPFVLVAALLYLLFSTADPRNMARAAVSFNWMYLAPLAGAYLLYLALRSLRWHLLMKPLKVPNSWLDSLLLFFGAQAALLVPAGQFLLPLLQKSQHGTLIRRSAATVVVQEIVFALLVVPAALPSIQGYRPGWWLVLAAFLVSVGSGMLMLHDGMANVCLRVADSIPLVRNHAQGLRELRSHIITIVNTREALLGSALDLLAIGAAGTGLYVAMVGLGVAHVGWIAAIGTYAFGNIMANLSALPGGLGANEDASAVVLGHVGLAAGPAAALTIIFRGFTLLLGTLLGVMVLLLCRRRFNFENVGGLFSAVRA